MGITSKGAWEAVKRHFREIGTDIQTTDFSVVGVGDMSGDVFGNGMLLSKHIKLIGAFNHQHIFIDPDPDPAATWTERKRLFDMQRSSWTDYDKSVLSKGGAIYDRSAKSVTLSPEAQARLGLASPSLTPQELIQALLRQDVDLLWSGGIGTYVKASSERHGDAGDRANDSLRVDANMLRAKVVGEGANLAMTQRAGSNMRWLAAGSTPTRWTTRPASTLPTTRSTSRSACAISWKPTTSRRRTARPSSPRSRMRSKRWC